MSGVATTRFRRMEPGVALGRDVIRSRGGRHRGVDMAIGVCPERAVVGCRVRDRAVSQGSAGYLGSRAPGGSGAPGSCPGAKNQGRPAERTAGQPWAFTPWTGCAESLGLHPHVADGSENMLLAGGREQSDRRD